MGSTIAESLKTLTNKIDETIKHFDAFSLELESEPLMNSSMILEKHLKKNSKNQLIV